MSRADEESQGKRQRAVQETVRKGASRETHSDLNACFVPLSLSISVEGQIVACYGGCEALVDTGESSIIGPRRLVNKILRFLSARPGGSKVKGHAPGSLPVSTHNKDLQGQPLSLSL